MKTHFRFNRRLLILFLTGALAGYFAASSVFASTALASCSGAIRCPDTIPADCTKLGCTSVGDKVGCWCAVAGEGCTSKACVTGTDSDLIEAEEDGAS